MTVLSFARRGLSALLVAAACLIAQAATAQTFSAANWKAFAALNGGSPNNQVRAMAEYQGDLYVGGTFAQVGGEPVYYVARWDGYQWEKLGDGVNNAVYAMTVYDGKLIVGGSFTTTSGVSALRIASWDGEQWAPLGDGLNSSVVDLTVYNGELIAGGIFTAAGGISVNRIARWDGSNWHAMGGPDQGTVNSLSEYNGDLIAVGSFYMVNGENHNYITRWDGSSWSSLGEGLNTTVNDAVVFQGKLYATGQFTGSGGHALPYIAAWDGNRWSAVSGGLSDAGYALYADNDKLYVGGQFETADGISSLGIAAWDGSSWQAVGDGLGLYAGTVIRIYRIAKFDNEILLGGLLDKNGVVNLVRLNNGSQWQGLQSTFLDGSTQVVAEYDGDTIVGGDFTEISGVAANRVARWDGSQWHAMGDGFNGTVTTIASYQGELYAAGAFDHSGSSAVAHVARWDSDGQTWQPLTIGVNNTVYRVKVINDELWVLGDFSSAGGESATGMARWDGSQWLGVDFPYQVHYGPTDVVEYQGEVVVSGRFYNPEGFLLFKVAAFDGEQWYPLELDAVTGMVQSMVVHHDVLYVTGNIYRMNESTSASGVAAWDGSQWSNVGDSDVGSGKTLQSFKETLFLGSDSGLYVLKDGTFQQPDTSVDQLINGLGIAGDSLYLAGAFSSAGGQPAQNLARLIPNLTLTLDAQNGDPAETARYFPDTTIPLPQPQRDGYLLEGWNTASDGSGTGYTDSLPLGGTDQTLYAQWQLEVYTVSFDTDGGEALDDLELAPDATINAPTPVREGHTFLGWQPALPATMPRTDLAVTAQWQVNSYTLTFNSAGGSAVAALTQDYGSAVTAPAAPVREGHTFLGWNPALPATVPARDLTVTAQWSVNAYTLTFDSAGGTAVAPLTQDYGTTITAPAAPQREFHVFQGWSPAVPATMPAANQVLTAVWQEFTRYTAAVVVQGEGQVSPASQTLYQTQSAQFTLTLNDPDDYVTVNGCGAALAGGLITTAPLTASCTVQVGIFPSTQPEKDKEGPLASAESVRFRLQGGAGEKALSSVYLMRAGVDAPLFGDDMNTLLTLNEDGSYTFLAERTGRYTLLFSDAVSGEITEVTIDVLPYLAFTSSHRRALREDTSALTLWLSDEPIEYPVTATLNGSDMGFESQSVSLFENDARRLELAVPTGAGDTAAVDLTDLDSALPGNPVQQALTLQSDPLPLSLELTVTQGLLMDTRVVGRDRGTVIIHVDAGGAQVDQYDWQAENLPLSSNGNQAAFNLETLEAGSYEIAVTATTADTRGVALATLQVVETCPTEGCYALAQRVPPSANPFADEPHRLALCPGSRVSLCGGEQKAYLETAGPFRLALGTTSSNQSWASGEFALGVSDGSLPRDNAYLHQGVAVDFEIQALDQPGETVPVAIPLVGDTVIPAGAVWRKYLNGGWHLFLEDAFNQLHSAPKNGLGLCPVVSADSWTPGLTEGDACVRLMIQDGGPNDADGQADGMIRDPGTLAVKRADEARPEDLWGGGGAAGGLMVGLLSLLALRRRRVGAA